MIFVLFLPILEKPMNKIKSILIVITILLGALPLMAQQKRVSPHETISSVIVQAFFHQW